MPIAESRKLAIQYREGFDELKASDAELALICSVLPELLVEAVAGAEQMEGEGYGRCTVRSGLDDKAG